MAAKRETIEPNSDDKRYIRRDADGQFTSDQSDIHRSLSADSNQKATNKTPKGQGDKGDNRKAS